MKYSLIKDEKYGYIKLMPTPTQEEVEKYYLEEFYSVKYKQFNNSQLSVQQNDKVFFDSKWETILNNINHYFEGNLQNKSVFDIGFGFAQALLYFRSKGLEVSGIEPVREGYDYALSQGLNVINGNIEELKNIANKFDIVLMNNVLEHLREPHEVLSDIKRYLLKPGGILVIDVPNDFNDFQVIANSEYALNEWWVCPPNHINYFSGTSLSALLIDIGYEIVSKEASFPLELFLLFGDVYVNDRIKGKECHNKRVQFEMLMKKYNKEEKLKEFYKHLAELDLGRNIVVYCK